MDHITVSPYRVEHRAETRAFGFRQKLKHAVKAVFLCRDPWIEVAMVHLKQGIRDENEGRYINRMVVIGPVNDVFDVLMAKPRPNVQDALVQKLRDEYGYWANHEKKEPHQITVVNEHLKNLVGKFRHLLDSDVISSLHARRIIQDLLDDSATRPPS